MKAARQSDLFLSDAESLPCHDPVARDVGNPPSVPGQTSVDAAIAIEPDVTRLRRKVLAFIERCEEMGATREEIEVATGLAGNTVRPRIRELQKLGLVQANGQKRSTQSGRMAEVLVANRSGR